MWNLHGTSPFGLPDPNDELDADDDDDDDDPLPLPGLPLRAGRCGEFGSLGLGHERGK